MELALIFIISAINYLGVYIGYKIAKGEKILPTVGKMKVVHRTQEQEAELLARLARQTGRVN